MTVVPAITIAIVTRIVPAVARIVSAVIRLDIAGPVNHRAAHFGVIASLDAPC